MERKAALVVKFVVAFLGIVMIATGFAAEATRTKVKIQLIITFWSGFLFFWLADEIFCWKNSFEVEFVSNLVFNMVEFD